MCEERKRERKREKEKERKGEKTSLKGFHLYVCAYYLSSHCMMQMHVHAQYVWYHSRCVFFPHKYMHISSWHTKIRRTCSRTLNRCDITRERESTPQRTCARACVLEEVLRIFVFHELMCIYLWGKKTHLSVPCLHMVLVYTWCSCSLSRFCIGALIHMYVCICVYVCVCICEYDEAHH